MQNSSLATVLVWNGISWVPDATLSPLQYRFDPVPLGGQTDLYLPFDLIGISEGGSLSLVAFAAEEPDPAEGLHVWATMPAANPVNSRRANQRAAAADLLAGRGISMPLFHFFRWETTGDGVCPNGTTAGADEANTHTELDATVTADPAGVTFAGLGDGVFWAGGPDAALAAASSNAAPLDDAVANDAVLGMLNPAHEPLPDGQPVSLFRARVANTGSHTLVNAWLALSGYGPLRLLEDRLEWATSPWERKERPYSTASPTLAGQPRDRPSRRAVDAAGHGRRRPRWSGCWRGIEWTVGRRRRPGFSLVEAWAAPARGATGLCARRIGCDPGGGRDHRPVGHCHDAELPRAGAAGRTVVLPVGCDRREWRHTATRRRGVLLPAAGD